MVVLPAMTPSLYAKVRGVDIVHPPHRLPVEGDLHPARPDGAPVEAEELQVRSEAPVHTDRRAEALVLDAIDFPKLLGFTQGAIEPTETNQRVAAFRSTCALEQQASFRQRRGTGVCELGKTERLAFRVYPEDRELADRPVVF